jgi:transcription initiation factor TFIID subunit 5
MKKGYTRTEQTLRMESANVDRDGRPVFDRAEDFGGGKYRQGFALLRSWIDQNLDVYKVYRSHTFIDALTDSK